MRCHQRVSMVAALVTAFLALSAYAAGPSIPKEMLTFDSAGVPICYVEAGQGEPVILIHGFAINHHFQWVAPKVMQTLVQDFHVVAIDDRGHGKSGKPHDPNQYGVQMVEDVVRLMDHLDIEKAHIVGYSMGGAITLKLLVTHPDRVRSAVVGGMGWLQPTPEWLTLQDKLAASLESDGDVGPLLQRLTPTDQAPRSPRDIMLANMVVSSANDPKALAATIRGMLALQVTEEQLKVNKLNVLSIVGEVDPISGVDELRRTMPHVTAVDIPGQGHTGAFFDRTFRESIHAFLEEQSKSVETTAVNANNER